MKRTIILVDHKTGRKFKIVIDPEPSCNDCREKFSQESLFVRKLTEIFDRERNVLSIRCAICGKELGEYKAQSGD